MISGGREKMIEMNNRIFSIYIVGFAKKMTIMNKIKTNPTFTFLIAEKIFTNNGRY